MASSTVELRFLLKASSAELDLASAKARASLSQLGGTHSAVAGSMSTASDKVAKKNAELVSGFGQVASALGGIDPALSRVISGTLRLSSGFTATAGAIGAATVGVGLAIESYQQMQNVLKEINAQREQIIASSDRFVKAFGFKGSWSGGTASEMSGMLSDELQTLKDKRQSIIDSAPTGAMWAREHGIVGNLELDVLETRITSVESNLKAAREQVARDRLGAMKTDLFVGPLIEASELANRLRKGEQREMDILLNEIYQRQEEAIAKADRVENNKPATMESPGAGSSFTQQTKWFNPLASTKDNIPQTLVKSLDELTKQTNTLREILARQGLAS